LVTSNHPSDHGSADNRPAGSLLAGVCTGLAQKLGWNVWAIRGLFVFGLFIQIIATGIVYILLAVLFAKFGGEVKEANDESALKTDELSHRQQRIAELERRFKEMEKNG